MSFPDKDTQILEHVLGYCQKIEKTIERFGKDFDLFKSDADYMDSISMNLLQIGELVGRLSDEYVQATRRMMDWRAIKGMRNMFAHNYGAMEIERIWHTAIEDIPMLQAYCRSHISP